MHDQQNIRIFPLLPIHIFLIYLISFVYS